MFQINDTVLYGIQGAYKITGITTKKICGKTSQYYVLTPIDSSTCITYIPVGNEAVEKKMRPLLSADEIYKLIHSMPDTDELWITDDNQRKEKYKQILANGDRKELIQMIKALYIHKKEQRAKGRKLHIADEHFLKDAEKMLYNEFSVVLNIAQDEVLPFIKKEIE